MTSVIVVDNTEVGLDQVTKISIRRKECLIGRLVAYFLSYYSV
jgi:hypothetical protein